MELICWMHERLNKGNATLPGQCYTLSCLQPPHIKWLTPKFLSTEISFLNSRPRDPSALLAISTKCFPSTSISVCLKLHLIPPNLLLILHSVLVNGTVHLVVHLVTQFISWQCLKVPFSNPFPLSPTTVTSIEVPLISHLDCGSNFLTCCFVLVLSPPIHPSHSFQRCL